MYSATFLGVILHPKLCFTRHMAAANERCIGAMAASCRGLGVVPVEAGLRVFDCAFRPIVTYALGPIASRLTRANLEGLGRTLHAFLRKLFLLPICTRLCLLDELAGRPRLAEQLRTAGAGFGRKAGAEY